MDVKDGITMVYDLTDLIKLREFINWMAFTYYDDPTATWIPMWDGINVNKPFNEVMTEIFDEVEKKIGEQLREVITYPDMLTNPRLHLVHGEIKEDLDD